MKEPPPGAKGEMAGNSLPEELVGLGDVDDIRCTVFQWRTSQRRAQHSWLERTVCLPPDRRNRQLLSVRFACV